MRVPVFLLRRRTGTLAVLCAMSLLAAIAVPGAEAARVSATEESVSVVADDADGANDLRVSRSGSVVTVVEARPGVPLSTSSALCAASEQTVTCTLSEPGVFLDVDAG